MPRLTALLIISSFLFSCKQPTGIKEMVTGADSVAINFFKGDGSMDSVFKVKIIRDRKTIHGLASYIESSSTQNFKCGYDGNLHFFKNNMVLKDVDFRMNDAACMHFSFFLDGKLYSTKLSAGAKELLRSVAQN